MPTIQTLHLSRLRHPEVAQFLTRFLDDLDKKALATDKEDVLDKLITSIRVHLPSFQQSLEQVRASEKSVSISEADELRDADFQALRDSIKPYRVSKREAEKSAYASLKLLFDQYKDTTKANYEEETALLTSFLDKVKSQYSDQISTLAIDKFVTNLEESHREFGLNYLDVEDAIASHVSQLNLSIGPNPHQYIKVQGKTIQYRPFVLSDGKINIGTYFIPYTSK